MTTTLHSYCTSFGKRGLPTFRNTNTYLSRHYLIRIPGSLLHLPNEIIDQIVRRLPCPDILNVMLTCQQLKTIAATLLYESITIRKPENVPKLARSISNNLNRRALVISYTLEITREEHDRYCKETKLGSVDFDVRGNEDARILGLLPNLEHLRIKSPWASYEELPHLFDRTLQDDSSGEPRISSHLKTLYIEYYGPPVEHYRLQCSRFSPFTNIFRHPGLEALTLVLMAERKTLPDLKAYKSSSRLKKLRLINCDMKPLAVSSMIGVAKALEELEISMTMPNGYMPRRYSEDSMLEKMVSCMASAKRSLKKLVLEDNYADIHDCRPWIRQPRSPLLFGEFTSLKYLEIFYDYVFGGEKSEHSHLPNIFPPNLETLKFLRRGCRSYPPSRRIPLDIPTFIERNSKTIPATMMESYILSFSIFYWERFVRILDDPEYLQNLRRIILRREAPFPFSLELEAACKENGIKLLEDPIYLRPRPSEDNFYEEGGEFPHRTDAYFSFGSEHRNDPYFRFG